MSASHGSIAAFHEGLRLNPTARGARAGLLQAQGSRNLLIRTFRRMERPFTKWIQRLPPNARWLGAIVYAVFYTAVVWVGTTVMVILLVMLAILTGL